MKPQEIRIVFHGMCSADYFQGHGVAFTRYTGCVTGAGDSNSAALDDALEQIASAGDVEISDEMIREAVKAETGLTLEALESQADFDSEDLHDECPEESDHECNRYFYVSIDWR